MSRSILENSYYPSDVVSRLYVRVEWTAGVTALKEMMELVEQAGLISHPVLMVVFEASSAWATVLVFFDNDNFYAELLEFAQLFFGCIPISY